MASNSASSTNSNVESTMNKKLFPTGIAAALVGFMLPASAHHSFPAHYVAGEMVTIEGVVTEFLWRNPHSFVYVEATNDAGEPEIWALEWNNTIIMGRMGFTADTILPGDMVVASGNPSRNGSKRIRMVTLERPADGFSTSRTGGAND